LGRGATVTQNRLWVRFPQFTTLTLQGANTGSAIYHSLQMKADKRLSRGLNLLWAYTFSKQIDNNSASIINARHFRSVSGVDQRHVLRLAFTYAFPFQFSGKGANLVLR